MNLTANREKLILIVAHYGTEKFWYNIRRLKRTGITFVVGKPFLLVSTRRMNKKVYQEMTNQIMTRLASMLPKIIVVHIKT